MEIKTSETDIGMKNRQHVEDVTYALVIVM